MGNEAVSLRMKDYSTSHSHSYEVIETSERLEAIGRHIITTQVQRVALVTITLSFVREGRAGNIQQTYSDPQECTLFLLQGLRPLVRKTDTVCLFKYTLYFFLLGANIQGAQIAQNRLWEALLWRIHNISEGEIVRPRSIVSGLGAHPSPSQAMQQCIEAACDPVLHANFGPEKPARRALSGQAHTTHPFTADEELPALARRLGIPYLSLLPRKPPARVQQLVNAKLAHELRCYPLGRERNMLTVAMLDPQDRFALERLHRETGLEIYPVLTHPQVLQTALDRLT